MFSLRGIAPIMAEYLLCMQALEQNGVNKFKFRSLSLLHLQRAD